jgi:hypothetical protein
LLHDLTLVTICLFLHLFHWSGVTAGLRRDAPCLTNLHHVRATQSPTSSIQWALLAYCGTMMERRDLVIKANLAAAASHCVPIGLLGTTHIGWEEVGLIPSLLCMCLNLRQNKRIPRTSFCSHHLAC